MDGYLSQDGKVRKLFIVIFRWIYFIRIKEILYSLLNFHDIPLVHIVVVTMILSYQRLIFIFSLRIRLWFIVVIVYNSPNFRSFDSTRVWIKGFILPSLVPYWSSCASNPFCSGCFVEWASGQPRPQLSYFILPPTAGITGMCHHDQLFCC
jgi:hypothetical protein